MSRKKMDPETEAATEVVEMEQKQENLARTEQAEREALIAQCHEVIGRVQAVSMLTKFGDVASLIWFKQVKESKAYRDLPGIGTWDKFCERAGFSRRKVDEDLQNLEFFGQEFLATVAHFDVGYKDLRKLRQLSHDGALVVDAEAVEIDGERIPLNAEHRDDLQAALERVIEAKEQLVEEKDATIRAKDKVIQAKEQVINRQEKDLAKHEGRAREKGYTEGEEAFLAMVEDHRTIIDRLFLKVDPEGFMPAEPTPRMKAAYVEMLGYVRRMAEALHDTGTAAFGELAEDGDWVPPYERQTGTEG